MPHTTKMGFLGKKIAPKTVTIAGETLALMPMAIEDAEGHKDVIEMILLHDEEKNAAKTYAYQDFNEEMPLNNMIENAISYAKDTTIPVAFNNKGKLIIVDPYDTVSEVRVGLDSIRIGMIQTAIEVYTKRMKVRKELLGSVKQLLEMHEANEKKKKQALEEK